MKKFLKSIFLFFILLFLLDKGFCFFLNEAPKKEYDKRLERVLEGKLNKDIIIIGSSLGSGNIIAENIEKGTGLTTYNLSYQGADVGFQKFILETLLKYNKPPKKVLMSIDSPHAFLTSNLGTRYDRLVPLAKYNYINDELIKLKRNNILSKVFCLGRIIPYHIRLKKQLAPALNPLTNHGSRPIIMEKAKKNLHEYSKSTTYHKSEELKDKLAAFKSIQQMCKEKNIELTFVFSPYYHQFNNGFYNRFKELTTPNHNIFVYDTLNPIYKRSDSFYDESHLMHDSARIFTFELVDFLNNN